MILKIADFGVSHVRYASLAVEGGDDRQYGTVWSHSLARAASHQEMESGDDSLRQTAGTAIFMGT